MDRINDIGIGNYFKYERYLNHDDFIFMKDMCFKLTNDYVNENISKGIYAEYIDWERINKLHKKVKFKFIRDTIKGKLNVILLKMKRDRDLYMKIIYNIS